MSISEPITVLLVDGHPIIRDYLARIVAADTRLAVAGEAGDGVEALRLAEGLRPDAMVSEVDLPRGDGALVLRHLRAIPLPIRVLVFTGHARPGPLHDILLARPDSLLHKGVDPREICGEIVAMVHGTPSRGRFNRVAAEAVAANRLRLDKTEAAVLRCAREGRSVPNWRQP